MTEPNAADDGWLVSGSADPTDVAAYYDQWAADYDADLDTWSYRAPDDIAALVRQHVPGASSVLDAGCGTGLAGAALRSKGFGNVLVGVDLSVQSLLEAGRREAHDGLVCADMQRPLPFRTDSFDAVMCVGVMTYVPDVDACWREFVRITAGGGLVAVTQREDVWAERDTGGVVDRLADEGLWRPVLVSDAEPYLPGHADFADRVGVRYVAAVIV